MRSRQSETEKLSCVGKFSAGYGLALVMAFLLSSVMLGASVQLLLSPSVTGFGGTVSQNYISAQELAKAGMIIVQADIQNQLNNGTAVTTSYTYGPHSVNMPSNPNAIGTLDKVVGSFTASMTMQRGSTYLVKVTATVGSSIAHLSKLLTMTRSDFVLDTITGPFAAYGLRRLNSSYPGPAIHVVSPSGTTGDVGFTASGDLDTAGLKSILGNTTLPIDAVASPKAAYSLRKLSSSWAGNAIAVRRSSDNKTMNIGFTASGDLDTTTLMNFVGSGSGYVKTWYDQSGNGLNATQATNANQPMIINSGTLETSNNRPALLFSFSSSQLVTANTNILPTGANDRTMNLVCQDTSPGSIQWFFFFGVQATAQASGAILNPQIGFWGYQADLVSATTPDSNTHVVTITDTSSTINVYQDGISVINGSTSPTINTPSNVPITIGDFNGYLSEILIYGSSITVANRQAIEGNQSMYYNSGIEPWGYVTTWYDQSGNSNLTQNTTANEPRIVLNGGNGQPTISFEGNQYLANSAMSSFTGSSMTSMSVASVNSSSSTTGQLAALQKTGDATDYGTSSSIELWGTNASTNSLKIETNSVSPAGLITAGSFFQSTTYHDGTNALDLYINGSLMGTSSVSCTLAPNYLVAGAGRAGSAISNYFTGNISELILYKSALARSSQQIIENDEISYFGLP